MAANEQWGVFTREESVKRASRLVQIVSMITVSPHRFKRKDLAAHFEISERMISKDLQIIRHGLKYDLELDQTGYYFENVPRLPAVQYPLAEAIALLTAMQAAQQVSGVGSPELAAAIARLEALFPPAFTALLRRASAPPLNTARGDQRHRMLMLLNQALVEEHKVHLTYSTRSRGGEINERVVHPYRLMPYERSWQLIAYCELRQDVLMFKIDRIQQAALLQERYRVPVDFDLDSYLGATWGILREAGQAPERVVLRFETGAGQRVMEEDWHPSQEAEVQSDGSVLFSLHTTVTPELVGWVLRYGSRVEVLEPEGLRAEMTSQAERMLRLYR